jgi:hypothetical protein
MWSMKSNEKEREMGDILFTCSLKKETSKETSKREEFSLR